MALAATQSPELVEQVYRASGAELKAVGINWVYSPVADVNTDSRNPVIGVLDYLCLRV
jgi:beta-N-acetylhexosaminidase